MEDTFLSVIVPVYNSENTVRNCIESILNQKFSSFELLLIDDGSTDNSLSICKEYSLKDKRVKCFHKDNAGVSSARNYGLDKCNGNYIAFIDSDDYIDSDTFQKCFDLFSANEIDAVRYNLIEDKGNESIPQEIAYNEGILSKNDIADLFIDYKLKGSACCFVIKKSVINSIRFVVGKHLR